MASAEKKSEAKDTTKILVHGRSEFMFLTKVATGTCDKMFVATSPTGCFFHAIASVIWYSQECVVPIAGGCAGQNQRVRIFGF